MSADGFVSGLGSQMNLSINLMDPLTIVYNVMRIYQAQISSTTLGEQDEIQEYQAPYIDPQSKSIIWLIVTGMEKFSLLKAYYQIGWIMNYKMS